VPRIWTRAELSSPTLVLDTQRRKDVELTRCPRCLSPIDVVRYDAHMDVFPIYEKLWHMGQDDGAYVHYEEWQPKGEMSEGRNGHFDAKTDETPSAKPEIVIGRDSYLAKDRPDRGCNGASLPTPPNLFEELITLAHEFGHYRSFREDRIRWERYASANFLITWISYRFVGVDLFLEVPISKDGTSLRQAVYQGLDEQNRNRILDEEMRAWRIGRKILAQLGLIDFARYNEREQSGLQTHRRRLGMDRQWPDSASDGLRISVEGGEEYQGTLERIDGFVEITHPRTGVKTRIPDTPIGVIRLTLS